MHTYIRTCITLYRVAMSSCSSVWLSNLLPGYLAHMETHNTREVGDNLVVGTNTVMVIMVRHVDKDYLKSIYS